jgi:hypothetical protein
LRCTERLAKRRKLPTFVPRISLRGIIGESL